MVGPVWLVGVLVAPGVGLGSGWPAAHAATTALNSRQEKLLSALSMYLRR